MEKVGVGIVGAGQAGRVHALAVGMLNARLVGIVASSPGRSAEASAAFGAERVFADAAELIADPAVDVVHICTPNDSHPGLIEAAFAAGKHVVCEKPLSVTVGDARRLATLAESSGLVAATSFGYRYQPVVRDAQQRIRGGGIEPVRVIHGTYLQDWLLYATDDNWRTSAAQGGRSRAFADIGSHWCDLAEWMTGHRVTDLAAVTATVHEHRSSSNGATPAGNGTKVDTEDVACVVFRATGGVVGTLTVSQVSPGRKNRLWIEVDAAEESVTFDQEDAEWLWLGSRTANRVIARDGTNGHAPYASVSALPAGHAHGFVECFAELFNDVYHTVRTGEPGDFPSFEDGARSAAITDAVLRAAAEHRWVTVP
ncbi:MAG TPA: Gfo/Idh/MocA family oxidoreductase [Solirubrobacteraceae bacterium]